MSLFFRTSEFSTLDVAIAIKKLQICEVKFGSRSGPVRSLYSEALVGLGRPHALK